jgi:hypothetical protein
VTLDELFDNFERSTFRLETLPQYLVDVEEERFGAFRDGRPLPPWPQESVEWFADIAKSVAAGKTWGRVHVIDWPPSDYTRFELVCYADNVRAGENIRIADRSADPALAELRQDFWLFDAETGHPVAVLMRYDEEGHWLGWNLSEERNVVQRCREQRDMALAHSVPLAEFDFPRKSS